MKKKIWAAGAALTIAALALPYGAAFAADEDTPAMTAQEIGRASCRERVFRAV